MSLSPGARLGPYEILAPLGAGGMGEVYKARDTKLDRDVAIKILPELFVGDPARIARFEREARLLASLNHPHIGAIYGIEDAAGMQALVLEFVAGESLASRLRSGPMPLADALAAALQIARALEAAHERGIVHRDLKPANILITPAGVVKVLDFGIAKAVDPGDGFDDNAFTAATLTLPASEAGLIVGTAAYMSPEQARGQPIDKRTDIWAFGCVLYEMLTGRRAFAAATRTDTLAGIIEREPDWSALPPATPPTIRRLLRRCLEKDQKRRLHDVADARIELEEPVEAAAAVPAHAATSHWAPRQVSIARWLGVFAAACAIGLAIDFVYFHERAAAIVPPTRLSVFTPGLITPQLSATISPDGRQLAFVSTDATGKSMLWLRPLDALDARVLPGTENAAHPFWSPDGRYLGFQAAGKIKTIEATGGPVQILADAYIRSGATWSRDGRILFIPRPGELGTVSAGGGPISPVQVGGFWPYFLPDGRHFLYFVGGPPERRGVWVGSIDSNVTSHLLNTEVKAAFAPPGYLLFVRGETLMAQPFDAERLELSGEPSAVADGVWVAAPAGQASFSVSRSGVLAYVNASLFNTQLAWLDRTGRQVAPIGQPDRWAITPQLSPDGKRIAIARGPFGSRHVWIVDASDGTASRVTFGAIYDDAPIWSRDGNRIAFESGGADGGSRLYVKSVSGTGSEELLFESPRSVVMQDWSPDGRFLVYAAPGEQGPSDLWLLPLSGDHRPAPVLQTPFIKTQAQISPDGRWMAYTSNESGTDEVYIQSFPTPGNKRQASSNGGVQPRWRKDGRELFYLASDQRLMAVRVTLDSAFEADAPVALFRTRLIPQGSQSLGLPTAYDVSPDGQRFVVTIPPEDLGPPITVVLNWLAALKR
jgi:Tol biopolymer transport system component/tRNA A-37 threonylcarbamoyl transferase component Bud32